MGHCQQKLQQGAFLLSETFAPLESFASDLKCSPWAWCCLSPGPRLSFGMLELNWEANKKRDSQSHNPGPSRPETPSDQHSQLLQGKLKFGEVTQSSLLEKKA